VIQLDDPLKIFDMEMRKDVDPAARIIANFTIIAHYLTRYSPYMSGYFIDFL